MHDLALRQGEVEGACFEPWHFSVLPLVLIASISSPGIEAAHAVDEGRAIDREAAARRRGAETDFHGLGLSRHGRQGGGGAEISAIGHGMSVAVGAAVDFDGEVAQPRKVGQAHLVVVDR